VDTIELHFTFNDNTVHVVADVILDNAKFIIQHDEEKKSLYAEINDIYLKKEDADFIYNKLLTSITCLLKIYFANAVFLARVSLDDFEYYYDATEQIVFAKLNVKLDATDYLFSYLNAILKKHDKTIIIRHENINTYLNFFNSVITYINHVVAELNDLYASSIITISINAAGIGGPTASALHRTLNIAKQVLLATLYTYKSAYYSFSIKQAIKSFEIRMYALSIADFVNYIQTNNNVYISFDSSIPLQSINALYSTYICKVENFFSAFEIFDFMKKFLNASTFVRYINSINEVEIVFYKKEQNNYLQKSYIKKANFINNYLNAVTKVSFALAENNSHSKSVVNTFIRTIKNARSSKEINIAFSNYKIKSKRNVFDIAVYTLIVLMTLISVYAMITVSYITSSLAASALIRAIALIFSLNFITAELYKYKAHVNYVLTDSLNNKSFVLYLKDSAESNGNITEYKAYDFVDLLNVVKNSYLDVYREIVKTEEVDMYVDQFNDIYTIVSNVDYVEFYPSKRKAIVKFTEYTNVRAQLEALGLVKEAII
jgi:hypothetical protein